MLTNRQISATINVGVYMEKKKYITADVELWKRVKARAALEGKTLSSFVSEVLEEKLRIINGHTGGK
jgi:macrodomain Ter protein organizer (MatP/YcbG family)